MQTWEIKICRITTEVMNRLKFGLGLQHEAE